MEIEIDKVISKYAIELQDNYKSFSGVVKDLLNSILKVNKIIPHSITNREKSPSSLKEKILRESKNYEDPLSEITDLAGVRIITFFLEDVDKIVPLIEKEFKVDPLNSIDKRKKNDPSIFGYISVHLIVEFSEKRSSLQEYSSYAGLKCEIQVRTILQHAWAEIEHDIVYKSNEEIPFELRHRFASLAGLLEVADREFEQLRKDEIIVREEIKKNIINEYYDLPINRDSLFLYLTKIKKEKSILPSEKGFERFPPNSISRLVKMLNEVNIDTIEKLHKILNDDLIIESSKELKKIKCSKADRCLLKYFLAIGIAANMDKQRICDFAHCPKINHLYNIKNTERGTLSKDIKRKSKNTPHNKPAADNAG